MKLEIRENELWILPESQQDESYIRDTMGLTEDGQSLKLTLVRTPCKIVDYGTYTRWHLLTTEPQQEAS